jgi:hypothetical protein
MRSRNIVANAANFRFVRDAVDSFFDDVSRKTLFKNSDEKADFKALRLILRAGLVSLQKESICSVDDTLLETAERVLRVGFNKLH